MERTPLRVTARLYPRQKPPLEVEVVKAIVATSNRVVAARGRGQAREVTGSLRPSPAEPGANFSPTTPPEEDLPSFSLAAAAIERAEIRETSSNLGQYLKEISRNPLLTAEEEIRLAQQMEQGNQARDRLRDAATEEQVSDSETLQAQVEAGEFARRRLTEANTRLVVSVARRYSNRGLDLLDLIQEGNIGLIRAVEKFDYRKGFKFSTYAIWWIRQAVTKALATQARTIRLPIHVWEFLRAYHLLETRLTEDLDRHPLIEEIAVEMEKTPAQIKQLLNAAKTPVQMSTPIGEGQDEIELGDFIEDPGAHDRLEQAGVNAERRKGLEEAMKSLTPRERLVLELRSGLYEDNGDPGKPMTLDEIAERITTNTTGKPVTRERVRQIEARALMKLRHPLRSKQLRGFIG